MKKPVISFFPAFKNFADLQDRVIRATWYFSCLKPHSIRFHTEVSYRNEAIPEYFNQNLANSVQKSIQEGIITFLPDTTPSSIKSSLKNADIIICWKDDLSVADQYGKAFELYLKGIGKKIYKIGPSKRMEGSLYIEVSKDYFSKDKTITTVSQSRFKTLSRELRNKKNAFLFASGPSVKDYNKFDIKDGISILCNSVINDNSLLKHIIPNILVFADPIFHFGCSSYAASFHKRLKEQAKDHNFTIIIPLKYYPIFVYNLPELKHRVIAIPYEKSSAINLDLQQNFKLAATDNILTFLMLPVATSLAKNIFLLGCDGRPLNENDYFWQHNKKTQFTEEMDSIKNAHPSFFKLEYKEYYIRHCKTLEKYITLGEKLGRSYTSLTFSHIPALKNRSFPYEKLLAAPIKEKIIVSINPDLESRFGHYLHYDLRLQETFGNNVPFVSLCSKSCATLSENIFVRPIFELKTWELRDSQRTKHILRFTKFFAKELLLLSLITNHISIFMYVGDLRTLSGILSAISQINAKKVSCSVNLFYSHFDIASASYINSEKFHFHESIVELLKPILGKGIQTYVDSSKLKQQMDRLFCKDFPLWPMIAVTDFNRNTTPLKPSESSDYITVFCPATPQYAKGFDQACNVIRAYINSESSAKVKFIVRNVNRGTREYKKLRKVLSSIETFSNVEVLDGNLSDKEYRTQFEKSDVILIPYRQKIFETRTSACLVDALFFKKCIVAAQDSWIGDQVKDFGAGYLYKDGNAEDLLKSLSNAIIQAKVEYDPKRKYWETNFSPKNLHDLLVSEENFNQESILHSSKIISLLAEVEQKYSLNIMQYIGMRMIRFLTRLRE